MNKVGLPPRHREDAKGFFGEIDEVLGQFFRGQFTVMVILGVLYASGYGVIGVPLALPIGILAGAALAYGLLTAEQLGVDVLPDLTRPRVVLLTECSMSDNVIT